MSERPAQRVRTLALSLLTLPRVVCSDETEEGEAEGEWESWTRPR